MATLLALAPALPSGEASKYVAAAYLVFLVLILVYVAIMAAKLERIERELRELADHAESRRAQRETTPAAGGTTETPHRDPQVQAVAEEMRN
jgi:type II secretory pathway component PulM